MSIVLVTMIVGGCGRIDYDPVRPSLDGALLDASHDAASGRTEVRCPAGETCALSCPTGSGCSFVCEAGSRCTADCAGDCDMSCEGTRCQLDCAAGSSSCTNPSGGSCYQSCPPATF